VNRRPVGNVHSLIMRSIAVQHPCRVADSAACRLPFGWPAVSGCIVRLLMFSVLGAVLFPSDASALRFTDDSYFVPKGVVGKPYLHVFELAKGGGSPPYHYQIANNRKLPLGLTLAQEDGKVTGTPLAAGKWSIWLHGIDSGLQHGFWDMQTEREFTFEILPALSIQQQSLEPTVLNRPYHAKLSADGRGTQSWSVVSGTLPQGISLAPDGTFSGTATSPGHFTFLVKVTDPAWDSYAVGIRKHMAGFRSDTRTFVLWVAKVGIELQAPGLLGVGRPMTNCSSPQSAARRPTLGRLPAQLSCRLV
jgi:hypothetical protein